MILDFQGKRPKMDATVFIAPNATVIGDVELGPQTSVWFYSLLRGDVNTIRIGAGCTIQDACILHVGRDLFPLDLEDGVVLGHRVTAHGCRIGRGAMIGTGATVLNGARVGEETIIGAGAVVTPGSIIAPRTLALGIPAKPVRELSERDFAVIRRTRESYRNLMTIYMNMPVETGASHGIDPGP
jgi:carbonic anhydrase/acetyltransferase-like protein (isoleucine patch superfamily)